MKILTDANPIDFLVTGWLRVLQQFARTTGSSAASAGLARRHGAHLKGAHADDGATGASAWLSELK
jgi:hypothetical protein